MTQHNPRKRPLSRASTASIQSAVTQPNFDQQALMAHHTAHHNAHHNNAFPEHWAPAEQGHQRDMVPVAQQMQQAGDMILRPASQMQGMQSFSMDANMHHAAGPAMPYGQPHMHPAMQSESFGANASLTDGESQIMDHDDAEDGKAATALQDNAKSGAGRSANNEYEMRQLFSQNRTRTLKDVAKELHGNDRGPNSERARQIFAMLWLNGVCTRGKGSVPRGRVYANYASRCATERITVLNPASFGKLVRVLFPGLRTRRLGVRGESKYHYVNFTLLEDESDPNAQLLQPALPLADSGSFAGLPSNSATSQSPALNTQPSALPSPMLAQQPDNQASSASKSAFTGSSGLFNQPDMTSIEHIQSSNAKTVVRLAFPPETEEHWDVSDPLVLPKIDPFLPAGTDIDAAKSLSALYRSHCTSLVECIRFCKAKNFFHLFTAFQGTLTMPVQKLFSHPAIAPWIEECDFVLYQRMMRIVFSITLQVMPTPVLELLQRISEKLILHVRESFQGQPRHVVEAKEAPAVIFTGLLDRALRVNLNAHATANMLSLPENRDQMYLDWLQMARIRKAAESVPTIAMDDVVNLLLEEMRDLISPTNVPWEVEAATLYGQLVMRKGGPAENPEQNGGSGNGADVMGRWQALLKSLPRRFPYATPNDLVTGVQCVGLTLMRDFTISQGKSFGSWWVLKCWVDEMVSYIAAYGGFMKMQSTSASGSGTKSTQTNGVSQSGSRLSIFSDDLNAPRVSQPQPDRAPFPSQLEAHGQDSQNSPAAHDDSGIGIGIRTPEEEFELTEKFDFEPVDNQGLNGISLQ
ncbi:RFX DNA-binding domain-containing protein [Hypoxylon sp. FL1284]|nr:RFX DNA-binding domain-containing protein [Hypoxylon sp. FL1284]